MAAVTVVSVGSLTAQERTAQERPDTLVLVSSLAVPDSIPLTYVTQLVSGTDGSVFLLDAQTDGVLVFDSDGAFRRRIGRKGQGPGELLTPWRLGLLGQDTLWVVDAGRPRVNLYNASTGASLADSGPATWDLAAAAGQLLQPFAVLADHSVVAITWGVEGVLVNVLAFRVVGRQTDPEGVSLSVLDVQDRVLAVPVPAGGAGLQLRNPFSHGDMLAIGPTGKHVAFIRRPKPVGSRAFFTVERYDVLEGGTDAIRVPYSLRPLDTKDIRAWAADLGAIDRMVEMGVFPSHTSGVNAVLDALDEPDYYPPVRNRGRGIVEEAVLIDFGATMWFQVSDVPGRVNDWIAVSDNHGVSRVSVPDGARLLAVQGDLVWAERRDGFGVPSVHMFRVQAAGR
ncbi:6-bladed beta-propeller [Candidatus Palauibacter sp.]|uniref:6-bladed beta-propeller n=1 Tax=Candidatus Palauibacter sp. TaxID=3101350 RepID=UPI003B013C25